MPRRPDDLYLADMLEAADEVTRFIEGLIEDDFLGDSRTRRAVLQCLIQMGEAAARVSKDLRDRHPEVAWRGVIDMRNFAVHEYFAVDWDIIWVTAREDVPSLAHALRSILEQP